MAYEINDNRYKAEKRLEARDIFSKERLTIDSGTEIDSVLTSWIIVKESEYELFQGLDKQQTIDMMVELGYVSLIV